MVAIYIIANITVFGPLLIQDPPNYRREKEGEERN